MPSWAISSEFPDPRIIVLTTDEGDALCRQALEAGAQAFVRRRKRRAVSWMLAANCD
jgi:DNA-binding NarL/FixJ family response regulator